MPAGRPSEFTEEVGERILSRISAGESLRSVCRDEDMPDRTTVRRWKLANEEFRTQYARATEEQAEVYFDEIVDLARDAAEIPSSEMTQAIKLLTDNQKWVIARMNRPKYGDASKVQVGGDPDSPPVTTVNTHSEVNLDSLTNEDKKSLDKLIYKALQDGVKA